MSSTVPRARKSRAIRHSLNSAPSRPGRPSGASTLFAAAVLLLAACAGGGAALPFPPTDEELGAYAANFDLARHEHASVTRCASERLIVNEIAATYRIDFLKNELPAGRYEIVLAAFEDACIAGGWVEGVPSPYLAFCRQAGRWECS